jgi:phosphoenolpyruvate carboxylase
VQECYELAAEYDRKLKQEKLDELGNVLMRLDAGDSIVLAKSFSHMLNLANLAEEVSNRINLSFLYVLSVLDYVGY